MGQLSGKDHLARGIIRDRDAYGLAARIRRLLVGI
jgi:hypothetical protein